MRHASDLRPPVASRLLIGARHGVDDRCGARDGGGARAGSRAGEEAGGSGAVHVMRARAWCCADPQRFGNVLSGDGTHTWGFVDVMKAMQLLAALDPACGRSDYEP